MGPKGEFLDSAQGGVDLLQKVSAKAIFFHIELQQDYGFVTSEFRHGSFGGLLTSLFWHAEGNG
ncbi:unannotated protein [freshwater metagenome]|uniref:Unannotated protein n=1 Tax=freshwater metagenome TaxID=449393 RepID=A0A6J6U7S6_9ZZZZ